MTPPKAFLCHSSTDKATAEKLATDMTANGVNVWYDKWEIEPGDSLRRKIDEGIEEASHFLALLSLNSLQSGWVQTELDAGMVRRIEGSCRLIPVILDIADNEIPVTLRGLRWVRLERYADGVRELLNVCHNVDIKPPLGPVPEWAKASLPAGYRLSAHAQHLAILLCERSKSGDTLDPVLDESDIQQALGITPAEVELAKDELNECGWIRLHVGRRGHDRVSPEPLLFFAVDPYVKGSNPEEDAQALAACLVNSGTESIVLREVDKTLHWGPRRINPAAHFLVFHGIVKSHEYQRGGDRYAFYYIRVTPKTKRFASR